MSCNSSTWSLVFSLVYKIHVRWPWQPLPFSLCLFLSLSVRQQQPQGPQDILDPSLHHTSSPPPTPPPFQISLQLFFFFILLRTQDLQAALWLHLLRHMHGKGAQALCLPIDGIRLFNVSRPLALHSANEKCKHRPGGLKTCYMQPLQGQTDGSVAKVLLGNVIIWL